MTQNTQTTAERIETFLDSCLDRDWHEIDTHEAAQTIAAEIDALTAERDAARAQYRREKTITATLEHQLSGWNESYLKVEAERDEARAAVERYDSVISNAIAVLTIRARAAKVTP